MQAAVQPEQRQPGRAGGRQQHEDGEEGDDVHQLHHVRESMNAITSAMPRAMPSA